MMQSLTNMGNLPNLIIIGAMKCGTTSLHHYLDLHPEISMSRQKELDFFYQEKPKGNWDKGIEWYRSHFTGRAKIYGETSPNYADFPHFKNVPSRMFSLVPNAKLIYIVREPIERIISHYVHFCANGKENRNFESALADFENSSYIRRSSYFLQLQQYLAWFPPSNILIVTSEKLFNYPEATMRRVFQFLEVDVDFEYEFNFFDTKLHKSSHKRRITIAPDSLTAKIIWAIIQLLPPENRLSANKLLYLPFSQPIKRPQISDALRHRIRDYLSEDIEQLKAYTGYSFPEWD